MTVGEPDDAAAHFHSHLRRQELASWLVHISNALSSGLHSSHFQRRGHVSIVILPARPRLATPGSVTLLCPAGREECVTTLFCFLITVVMCAGQADIFYSFLSWRDEIL